MTPDQRDLLDDSVAVHDCTPGAMCGEKWYGTGDPFVTNKYARCECEIADMDITAPICTLFEDEGDPDCTDICIVCRHGEACHLKGHAPCIVCNGTKVIPSVGDCPECKR